MGTTYSCQPLKIRLRFSVSGSLWVGKRRFRSLFEPCRLDPPPMRGFSREGSTAINAAFVKPALANQFCGAALSFCRLESEPVACTTVSGACKVKFNTVSDANLIC